MGFPKSCNVGMRAVKTKYFVLMNNDVEVTKGWLSMLLEVMEKNPELGILGPKTNSVSGPQHDPNAHYNCNIGLEQYAYEVKKRKPPRIEPFPRIVFFCVLIRSKLYKKISVGLTKTLDLEILRTTTIAYALICRDIKRLLIIMFLFIITDQKHLAS